MKQITNVTFTVTRVIYPLQSKGWDTCNLKKSLNVCGLTAGRCLSGFDSDLMWSAS